MKIFWNWLLKEWPNFSFNKEVLMKLEQSFIENNGIVLGVLKHIDDKSKDDLLVEILSNEALKTSEIEGDFLNRESLQSSIKRNLGLTTEKRKVPPAEFGISEMMVDLYLNFDSVLSHEQLFDWHKMITNGRRDLENIGKYRTHSEPMQVVSGRIDKPNIHFESPPSKIVPQEMEEYIDWFNKVHSTKTDLDNFPLIKAGIAHIYFESIHPFEDGNGRIGRAIAEKSLALSINKPSLISLSQMIETNKKQYYEHLEANNKTLEITDWLVYFGKTILDAQKDTLKRVDFLIEKTKFFDKYSSEINERQLKVVRRMFEIGHQKFKGGLSAKNYKTIAKTSESTTTRDLKDLVKKHIFIKTGEFKSSRYSLNIKNA